MPPEEFDGYYRTLFFLLLQLQLSTPIETMPSSQNFHRERDQQDSAPPENVDSGMLSLA